ncbi:MAG: hypothetical protein NZM08_08940 [Chitinophagales bacterium]|nr:hypothetical protein [Chitinophagales bacterium]
MSVLVCDSGSTKAHWLRSDGTVRTLLTPGFNPYSFASAAELADAIKKEAGGWSDFSGSLFFYGAGCAGASMRTMMKQALTLVFPRAVITVHDDLLGAARAVAGSQPAIVLLLGTGMNNGLYDGNSIRHQVDSLGYVLGDEGSGTDLGRRVLQAALRGQLPQELSHAFAAFQPLSRDQILERIYRSQSARRFLADHTRFVAAHRYHPFMQQLLTEVYQGLVHRILSSYAPHNALAIHVSGSVGCLFEDEIKNVLSQAGFRPGRFLARPGEALLRFHLGRDGST